MYTTVKEKYVLKKPIKKIINKLLEAIIVFLTGMIIVKSNPVMAKNIEKEIYNKSFSFTKMNNLSKKYFGPLIPKVTEVTQQVFNEKINYIKKEGLENGIKLTVNDNTPIAVLENGMIMNIDNNSITIEQVDGVKVIYNNILNKDFKLYDYLEKGEIIGYSASNEISIIFSKEGEKVDYQKYL